MFFEFFLIFLFFPYRQVIPYEKINFRKKKEVISYEKNDSLQKKWFLSANF